MNTKMKKPILQRENLSQSEQPSYTYKYNGKELQEELRLNVYDYGARNYDPAIGRWFNLDPLAEKYPNLSPYVNVANSPTNAIDPDGRVTIFINGQHAGDGGKRKYWNGLDQRIANRFKDYHARYYDGALGGWSNTISPFVRTKNTTWQNRQSRGKTMGYQQAKEIYGNLKDGETVKIVTHSMGGAYGKGFIKGLKKYAKENGIDHKIERVLDLATYQGNKLQAEEGILNEQIAHTHDGVAGVSRIQGILDENFHETRQNDKTGKVKEHSVDSFSQAEINQNVREGNSSTSQPKPINGKINVDYEQN